MKRFQTILVAAALDGRDQTTLRHAAFFARAAQAKTVYIGHVTPTFDLPAETRDDLARLIPLDEDIEQQLKAEVEQVRDLFPATTTIRTVARQGGFVPEVVRLAAQKSADLLCLGRISPEAHDLHSASAAKLVRKAPCSTLVVSSTSSPAYSRILAPVDLSDHSRESLEIACTIARASPDAQLTVQHAYDVPTGWHKSAMSYEQFAAIMRKHAERHWQTFSERLNFSGVPWKVRFDLSEKTAKTVLAVSDEIDAQLIVLGSHGRTRPAEVLLGHVADTVCSWTGRTVLVVKRKGEIVNLLHAFLQFLEFEHD